MGGYSIISQMIEFVQELIRSLDKGYLFFGTVHDFIRYILDIALVSFLFYWILVFLRQTRAWQLLKGILLIVGFVAVCGVVGLDMVGFIFNKLLYVFAFLFIVIFQPELRRVLETVGLRSSGQIKLFFKQNDTSDNVELSAFVHEICSACRDMSRTKTGALILIERTTRLDELLMQENVVKFESSVTNSVLQSIFYKGSPMHDGGLLIRDGMIVAARCHVPLSVTMHSLERTGTRHRAAVGASEMGDTVVVVVSEERGTISIAVNGHLCEMKDDRELELNLAYLLGLVEDTNEKKGFLFPFKGAKKNRKKVQEEIPETTSVPAFDSSLKASKVDANKDYKLKIKTKEAEEIRNTDKMRFSETVFLVVISIFLSLTLWLYIQINNNPVVTKTLVVPITYSTENMPDDVDVSFPIDNVEIEVVGRANVINQLQSKDVEASIDFSEINSSDTGVVELPVVVTSADRKIYFRVEQQLPEAVSVTIYAVG